MHTLQILQSYLKKDIISSKNCAKHGLNNAFFINFQENLEKVKSQFSKNYLLLYYETMS